MKTFETKTCREDFQPGDLVEYRRLDKKIFKGVVLYTEDIVTLAKSGGTNAVLLNVLNSDGHKDQLVYRKNISAWIHLLQRS